MADPTNTFEHIMKDAMKTTQDIWDKFLPQSVQDQHQQWINEFTARAKALATAKKTGNYSRFNKIMEKSRATIVKMEKLSETNQGEVNDENMPAPTIIPPKKKVKKEKISKLRKTSVENAQKRSSDVIIQEPTIATIDLLDSPDKPTTRSSRLRTKKQTAQVDLSTATNASNVTEYEDAASELETDAVRTNSTFILPKKPNEIKKEKASILPKKPLLNETVVVSNPKIINTDPLLTDDESMEEPKSNEVENKNKNDKDFYDSPVKKKVEAFENMQHVSAMNSKANTSTTLRQIELKKGNVKEKALGFTPVSSSKLPQKIGTPLSLRSRTPLGTRAGQLFKEKSSKISSSHSVESSTQKKKKYEEAYLKAKTLEEKERERIREQSKLKEERHKLLLQQKEEKMKQLKEEHERKRLLAKQKADEQKKKDEAKRIEQSKQHVTPKKLLKNKLPIFMLQSPPRLPCADCYDSDEEGGSQVQTKPIWATNGFPIRQEKTQEYLGHKMKNTLFCCQSRDVDLRELFGTVEPRKLKRTSSAHWERPPRFTMLGME